MRSEKREVGGVSVIGGMKRFRQCLNSRLVFSPEGDTAIAGGVSRRSRRKNHCSPAGDTKVRRHKLPHKSHCGDAAECLGWK